MDDFTALAIVFCSVVTGFSSIPYRAVPLPIEKLRAGNCENVPDCHGLFGSCWGGYMQEKSFSYCIWWLLVGLESLGSDGRNEKLVQTYSRSCPDVIGARKTAVRKRREPRRPFRDCGNSAKNLVCMIIVSGSHIFIPRMHCWVIQTTHLTRAKKKHSTCAVRIKWNKNPELV